MTAVSTKCTKSLAEQFLDIFDALQFSLFFAHHAEGARTAAIKASQHIYVLWCGVILMAIGHGGIDSRDRQPLETRSRGKTYSPESGKGEGKGAPGLKHT